MNDMILSFYHKITQANIKNPVDSLYWLYSVENLIVKKNGISKRYLKVYFFNRRWNEHCNLMQMKLIFHGTEIMIQKFEVAHEYQNPNIMGFIHEIELTDDAIDIQIKGYIMDGKEYTVEKKPILIEVMQDTSKFHILRDFIETSRHDQIIFPTLYDEYWQCSCGYINSDEHMICPICARKKKDIQKLLHSDLYEIAIQHMKSKFHLNLEETVEVQRENFCTYVNQYYGVAKDDVLSILNDKELLEEQNREIDLKIDEYIQSHHVHMNPAYSFDENMDEYLRGLLKGMITKNKVDNKLDWDALHQAYDEQVTIYQSSQRKKKGQFIVTISVIGIVVISIFVYSALHLNTDSNQEKQDQQTPVVNENEAPLVNQEQHVSVYAGVYSSFGLNADGTVIMTDLKDEKYENGQSDIKDWKDLVSISSEQYHTVGLKKDGTVLSTTIYDSKNDAGQSNVQGWSDITQISAGTYHTVGLREDGSVVSTAITNSKYDYGQSEVEDWKDIIQIAAAWDHTIGLKKDGTVVSTRITESRFDYGETEVEDWKDIVRIASGSNHTLGLKRDGTVVAVGYMGDDRCAVSLWTDIVDISAGRFHSLGLKADGTVIATNKIDEKGDFGQNRTEDWEGITQISAGWFHSLGLRQDGTLVSTSITRMEEDMGQENIQHWILK